MGGTPLTALQLLSWPRDELPWSVAADVIDGAVEVLAEARCTLVGGHSIDDRSPKFGFAITGTVHPDRMITNDAARPGDVLVLTKGLGTGLISTAIKSGVASAGALAAATATMRRLNSSASRAAVEAGVRAGTDVTGFGLLGHLVEVLRASGVSATIETASIPVLETALDIAAGGAVPGGTKRNLASVASAVDFGDTPMEMCTLLADAQTSGGLLLAVPEADLPRLVTGLVDGGDLAAIVGRIEPPRPDDVVIVR
jgi:selenide,water dikinase